MAAASSAFAVSLVPTEHEPVLLTLPTRPRRGVVLIHGPGENRTGNNFLFAQLAASIVRKMGLAARFDLAGHGDSLAPTDLDVWHRQLDEVAVLTRTIVRTGAIHIVARGAHAALLPRTWPWGLRVALCPPRPRLVRELASIGTDDGVVEGAAPCPARHVRLWAAVGAEPNLVGGLRLPVVLLERLASELEKPSWDVEVAPPGDPIVAGTRLDLCTDDRLVRLEATRAVLCSRLASYLMHASVPEGL